MNSLYTRLAPVLNSRVSLGSLPTDGSALRSRLANIKGVRDFFDFRRMSRPAGWGEAQSRLMFNVRYFAANYSLIFASLSVYALLQNPLLLFVLVLAIGGFLGVNSLGGADLVLPWGSTITTQSLYVGLGVVTVPLFIIASPIATILWLIGAAGVTILGHAVLIEKPLESEFADQV